MSYIEPPDWLSFSQTEHILNQIAPALPQLVLVGGQAVNFWALRYRHRVPELQLGPFASKDIDFQGSKPAVHLCASLLNGRPSVPPIDDVQVVAGKVTFTDSGNVERVIDILNRVYGLDPQNVSQTAVPLDLGNAAIRIMHPLHCMMSRVHNVIGLPHQYDNQHGIQQVRASIICLREYVSEGLAHDLTPREALNIYQKVFRFARNHPRAKRLHLEKGLDVFDAVQPHPGLPEMFRTKNYPQMLGELQERRSSSRTGCIE